MGTAASSADLNWTSGPFSVGAWCNLPVNQNGVYIDIIGRYAYSSEGSNSGWDLQLRSLDDGAAGLNFVIFNNGAGGQYLCQFIGGFTAGDQMVLGTSDGSSTKSIYSGLSKTTHATAHFSPASSASSALSVAGNAGTSKLYVGCAWGRQLSDAEVQAFYLDPFSMIIPAEGEMPALRAVSGASFNPSWAVGKNIVIDGVAT